MGKAPGFLNKPRDFALNENGELYRRGRRAGPGVSRRPSAAGPDEPLGRCQAKGYVALKWEPVKTRFPAKYVVYRSTPLGEMQKVKETVETTGDGRSLIANTTYTYTVAAQSVQGAMSVPSAPVQAMAKADHQRPPP